MQIDLFAAPSPRPAPLPVPVPGLRLIRLIRDFVSPAEADLIAEAVDAAPWDSSMRRRVQHYGYRYDYRSRSLRPRDRAGPIPAWVRDITARMTGEAEFPAEPDQIIVNEYLPGQGIAQHVDCVPCFGNVVASLSLLSPCAMRLDPPDGGAAVEIDLPPRSLLVLSGEARLSWAHGIAARMSDFSPEGSRRR